MITSAPVIVPLVFLSPKAEAMPSDSWVSWIGSHLNRNCFRMTLGPSGAKLVDWENYWPHNTFAKTTGKQSTYHTRPNMSPCVFTLQSHVYRVLILSDCVHINIDPAQYLTTYLPSTQLLNRDGYFGSFFHICGQDSGRTKPAHSLGPDQLWYVGRQFNNSGVSTLHNGQWFSTN